MPQPRTVGVVGITGWLGSSLAKAVESDTGMSLQFGVARSSAGQRLPDVVAGAKTDLTIAGSLRDALSAFPKPFVIVDVSTPETALENAWIGLEAGCHLILAATLKDHSTYLELDALARDCRLSVLVAPNLSASCAALRLIAQRAAPYFDACSLEDRAGTHVPEPLATTADIADCIRATGKSVTIESHRHSSYTSEVRLSLRKEGQEFSVVARCDSGLPFIEGAIFAIHKAGDWIGVKIGMDALLT